MYPFKLVFIRFFINFVLDLFNHYNMLMHVYTRLRT